jgi:thiamine pyrophosphate-dependent acetolactate synthase large subunit-like protein
MNLGPLGTLGNQAPKNSIHWLCENGCYETNGSGLTPNSGNIRFAEFAKTAGYKKTYDITDLAEWEKQLPEILQQEGPVFVTLKVEPGEAYPENFPRLYSNEHREKFRQALAKS